MARISRRAFLRGTLASLAGVSAYGGLIEPGWLEIVRVNVPLRRLPDSFAGFTIAQVSDLHFGPFVKPSSLVSVVDAILTLTPDAIVITGDFVSRISHDEPDMIVQTLSRLTAPYGTYAVLGNHDWSTDAATVSEAVRSAGFTVLQNESIALNRDGGRLHLAGLDDVCFGRHDMSASLQSVPPNGAVLALVHEPDYADFLARDPRIILQLAGHTHGGQICLPFYGALVAPPWGRKYSAGFYQINDLTLYTNRGVGMLGLPFRFACRPELTLFTLVPAN